MQGVSSRVAEAVCLGLALTLMQTGSGMAQPSIEKDDEQLSFTAEDFMFRFENEDQGHMLDVLLSDLHANLTELQSQFENPQQLEARLRATLSTEIITSLQPTLSQMSATAASDLAQEANRIDDNIDDLSNAVNSDVTTLNGHISSLESGLTNHDGRLDDLETDRDRHETRLDDHDDDISGLETETEALKNRLDKYRACSESGLVYNETADECANAVIDGPFKLPTMGRCQQPSDEGSVKFDPARHELLVCSARPRRPARWIGSKLSQTDDFDLDFQMPSVFGYVRQRIVSQITELTLSFWMKTTFKTGEPHTFSYAVPSDQNALFVRIHTNPGVYINSKPWQYSTTSLSTGQWIHWAMTWSTSDGIATVYHNGVRVASTNMGTRPIPGNGIVTIGQEQDSLEGSFDPAQRYNGLLSRLYLHGRVLSRSEILALMCDYHPQDNVIIDWPDLANNIVGNDIFVVKSSRPAPEPHCPFGFDLVFEHADAIAHVRKTGFPTVTELTAAVWTQASDETLEQIAFSYANSQSDNSLFLRLNEAQAKRTDTYINNQRVEFTKDGKSVFLVDGKWHFFAFTWKMDTGDVSLYIDGEKVRSVSNISKGRAIIGGGLLTVGQEQDSVGGNFAASQRFNGRMTQLQFFSRALSDGEVELLRCQSFGYGDIFGWVDFRDAPIIGGNIRLDETSLADDVCVN